jgi:hypothetical protein
MAQEFRTFTQRVTDKENATTRIFNVQAKTLVDQFGNDVIDSNGKKIWFPTTFSPADAIAFGNSLASKSTVAALFDLGRNLWQGGPWDLQRSYNGRSDAPFAEVFTPAASYTLGLIGAAAGFPQSALMAGGGLHNLLVNPKTAGPNFGNNPRNPPFIDLGFRDVSRFAPSATIPNGSFQGNPTFASPADRFDASFNGGANGSLDNFYKLTASIANGNIAPTVGFTKEQAGSSLRSTPHNVVMSTPPMPDGWFNSMARNGEFDRITRSSGVTSPPTWGSIPATPAFQPDAVYSPDGNFISNFPTTSAIPARLPTASSPHGSGSIPQIITDKNESVAPSAIENRRYLVRRPAGQSQQSAFDEGAPAVQFVPSNEVLSPDSQNSFDDRFGSQTSSPFVLPQSPNFSGKPPSLWTRPPLMQERSNAIEPSGGGGLAGRIAALSGIDPDNPDQPVPPPGGLLALLLAAQR